MRGIEGKLRRVVIDRLHARNGGSGLCSGEPPKGRRLRWRDVRRTANVLHLLETGGVFPPRENWKIIGAGDALRVILEINMVCSM